MKIFCVQSSFENSPEHADEPVFFLKPESCILHSRQPFFIPEFSSQIIPLPHIVLKVSRLGKAIQPRFSGLYFNEITMGLDMEARDVLTQLIKVGKPWEPAKAYDASSPFGKFIDIEKFGQLEKLCFRFCINNAVISEFSTEDLRFSIPKVISCISENITLKMGDLIFAGGPNICTSIKIDDIMECYINEEKVLKLKIK
jgi:2-keto-4-pentenoate hydratase/2-oxohepta-3-ene-1,7-dioic acid hydratase in catechol pathway